MAHIITTMILSWKELCFFHQDMKKKLRKKIISSAIEKKENWEKKELRVHSQLMKLSVCMDASHGDASENS